MPALFNRASIFRSAHEHARRELTWGGRKWTYGQAFAIALRAVYAAEREDIAEAAYEASSPLIPAATAERASRLRDAAWGQRIDASSALMAQARDLEHAARGF